jgi:histidinol-phosphate aminotransferase
MIPGPFRVPTPRPSVASPDLWRPDWTRGVPRDDALLWLDKNENDDPALRALALRIIAKIGPTALSCYPECTPLYRKLGNHLGVGADHLLLTAGSDGAIRSVFEAFVEPGDVVLHTMPTFAMYQVYSRLYGARNVGLEYARTDRGPSLSVDDVIRSIHASRPRVVCVPNPDSPTGTVFAPDEIRRIVQAAGSEGAVMLVDEAYHPFYPETVLGLVDEYPHLVVARTFAKAWGVAGLRIGYAAACPELTGVLHKTRPMYEVNSVAVAVMERMLDHVDEVLASVARLNEGRDAFLAAMDRLGLPTVHARGNFAHVLFGSHGPAVHQALAGLALYRGDSNDTCLKGYSRFSATTRERFQPIIQRIEQVVAGSTAEDRE